MSRGEEYPSSDEDDQRSTCLSQDRALYGIGALLNDNDGKGCRQTQGSLEAKANDDDTYQVLPVTSIKSLAALLYDSEHLNEYRHQGN